MLEILIPIVFYLGIRLFYLYMEVDEKRVQMPFGGLPDELVMLELLPDSGGRLRHVLLEWSLHAFSCGLHRELPAPGSRLLPLGKLRLPACAQSAAARPSPLPMRMAMPAKAAEPAPETCHTRSGLIIRHTTFEHCVPCCRRQISRWA